MRKKIATEYGVNVEKMAINEGKKSNTLGSKELFIENGGENLKYIPCLNSNEDQINMLQAMVEENIQGW